MKLHGDFEKPSITGGTTILWGDNHWKTTVFRTERGLFMGKQPEIWWGELTWLKIRNSHPSVAIFIGKMLWWTLHRSGFLWEVPGFPLFGANSWRIHLGRHYFPRSLTGHLMLVKPLGGRGRDAHVWLLRIFEMVVGRLTSRNVLQTATPPLVPLSLSSTSWGDHSPDIWC